MIVLRKGPATARLTLLLSACALVGLTPASRADAKPVTPKGLTSSRRPAPLVKIDGAMLQERVMLPDGTIHLGTYLDASLGRSAKNTPKREKGGTDPAHAQKA